MEHIDKKNEKGQPAYKTNKQNHKEEWKGLN